MSYRAPSTPHSLSIAAAATAGAGFTSRILQRFMRAAELHRQRRQLARLENHLLDDIGLTRDEAARELRRSFWK